MYHNPSPEVFEKHLQYLSSKYNFISLSQYCNALPDKNKAPGLPKNSLIITFDDGWKENYLLLPLIQKYNIKPVVFLVSHLIDTHRCFWWTKCKPDDIRHLKQLPNQERLHIMKAKYRFLQEKEFQDERQALNLQELEAMKYNVEFGLHTCFHPILTQCTSEEKRMEIINCKTKLEAILGKPMFAFAYPNGDYDDECIAILKECGIKIARTTDAGWNNKNSNPYKLRITSISDNGSITKLVAELTGIPLYFQHLFDGGMRNHN